MPLYFASHFTSFSEFCSIYTVQTLDPPASDVYEANNYKNCTWGLQHTAVLFFWDPLPLSLCNLTTEVWKAQEEDGSYKSLFMTRKSASLAGEAD